MWDTMIVDGTYKITHGKVEVASETYGYWVGIGAIATIPHKPKKSEAVACAQEFAKFLTYVVQHNGYVGVWTDKGTVYFDKVAFVATLNDAIALGRTHKEIAIWDIARNRAITL